MGNLREVFTTHLVVEARCAREGTRLCACTPGTITTDCGESRQVWIARSSDPADDPFARHRDDRGAGLPARSFHIELNDAQPVGGGYIAGRVHQHGPRPLGTMAVTVRCTEAWRSLPP
jgi:hypothetical protein